MYDNQSLSHTMWECKYHLAWIPKYRKKAIYGDLTYWARGPPPIVPGFPRTMAMGSMSRSNAAVHLFFDASG